MLKIFELEHKLKAFAKDYSLSLDTIYNDGLYAKRMTYEFMNFRNNKGRCFEVFEYELRCDSDVESRYYEIIGCLLDNDVIDISRIVRLNISNLYPKQQKVMDNLKADFKKRVRNDVLDSMRYSWSYLGKYPARKENEKETVMPEIKKVYFNKPVTVVIWSDGTKTIVRAQGKEKYNKEKGLAMAIAKKALGNKGDYYDEFKKWLE